MIGTGTGILYHCMSITPFAQLFVSPSLSRSLCSIANPARIGPSPSLSLSPSPLSARSPTARIGGVSDLIGLLRACGRRREKGEETTQPQAPSFQGVHGDTASRQARSVLHQVFTVAGRSALRPDPLFSRRWEQFVRMCALEGDDHALSATTGSFHHGAEGRQRPCRLQGIVY